MYIQDFIFLPQKSGLILFIINFLLLDDPVPQEIKESEDPKEKFFWLYNNIEEMLKK